MAREYETLDDMKAAIESDGYPWIQLYDLDGAEGVWPLYGLSDAGGGIFLIDGDGKIVRHVREISEVEEYLKENLCQKTRLQLCDSPYFHYLAMFY